MKPVAAKVGYPVDGVLFVADALKTTWQRAPREPGKPPRHLSAREVCDGFPRARELVLQRRAEARELIAKGPHRSEDVGKVFSHWCAGHGKNSDTDEPSDFDGLS